MAKQDDLVVCGEFSNERTAKMAMDILENHGIPSMMDNTAFSSLFPMPIGTLGAVRLLVRPDDAPRAKEIVASTGLD